MQRTGMLLTIVRFCHSDNRCIGQLCNDDETGKEACGNRGVSKYSNWVVSGKDVLSEENIMRQARTGKGVLPPTPTYSESNVGQTTDIWVPVVRFREDLSDSREEQI